MEKGTKIALSWVAIYSTIMAAVVLYTWSDWPINQGPWGF